MPSACITYTQITQMNTKFADALFFWVAIEPTIPERVKILGVSPSLPGLSLVMEPADVKTQFFADIPAAKRVPVSDFSV